MRVVDVVKKLEKSEDQLRTEEICRPLHISSDEAYLVQERIRLSIAWGLTKQRHAMSSIKCFPTYVTKLPTGNEAGKYLALDLGGSNFRVVLVQFRGDLEPLVIGVKVKVPGNIIVSKGFLLFEYIADQVLEFVTNLHLNKEELSIGFTFSFPCRQTDLKSGTLIRWTKGYNCPDVVGQDVCELLQAALDAKGMTNLRVKALLNDTTGCLLSCAWKNRRCKVGLIVGTGTNACYVERRQNVEMATNYEDEESNDDWMIINTEWGAFGENGELDFMSTRWDKLVDASSLNPGGHIFEKMISGLYLGDLVRNILLELSEQRLLFQEMDYANLTVQGQFKTKHVLQVEEDPMGCFVRCRQVLKEVLQTEDFISDKDCYKVRYVCNKVSRRACLLIAAGIGGLLKTMEHKKVVIAVDGTPLRKHSLFPSMIQKELLQLTGIEYELELIQSEDGSGLGAAVIAAIMT